LTEPEGFRDYVAARQRGLLRAAWLMTGDWHAAEDLVQAALVRVWPRWTRVVAAGDPDAYVRRVLVNVYLSARRRRWRGEYPTGALPDPPSGADEFASVDLRDAVARALSALGRRQRAVVVLRYFNDLPEVQVAAVMGCSVGTVKSQSAKALAKLRVALASAAISGGTR
jgi:RNA polymerase sigma-70 factor (sigma-E family)